MTPTPQDVEAARAWLRDKARNWPAYGYLGATTWRAWSKELATLLAAARSEAQRRVKRLRAALQIVQWGSAPINSASECPYCLHLKRMGHASDCVVRAALGEQEAE